MSKNTDHLSDADYIRELKIVYPLGDETYKHNARLERIAKMLENMP